MTHPEQSCYSAQALPMRQKHPTQIFLAIPAIKKNIFFGCNVLENMDVIVRIEKFLKLFCKNELDVKQWL